MSRIPGADLDEIVSDRVVTWSELAGKTVLVTGAGGMLPSWIVATVQHLNDRGLTPPARVVAVVRDAGRARETLGDRLDRPDLDLVVGDVADGIAWDGPVDFVVHAASPASPRTYGSNPIGVIEPNVLGTTHLLRLAHARGARLLFLSSSEVYGPSTGAIVETVFGGVDPATVRACYAESKRLGETLCVAWHHQRGVPAVIVRPFHTYGPTMRLDDGRVFADLVACVAEGRDVALNSDGSARRAFCYVTDATVGFFVILLRGEPGVAYNLGNPDAEVSVRELAERLVAMAPERGLKVTVKEPEAGYLRSAVARVWPDIGRLRGLGWSPKVGIDDGFRRVLTAFGGGA